MTLRFSIALLFAGSSLSGYPLDGGPSTGIRRLVGYKLSAEGKVKGVVKLPPGAFLRADQVVLRLTGVNPAFDVSSASPRDAYLQSGLEKIFGPRDPSYAVAMVEITDPAKPLYASLRGDDKKMPGSVGKLCVTTGLFGALAQTWPNVADRQKVLRETMVEADSFIISDSKTVPIYNDGDTAVLNRALKIGDKFNLFEWIDHMLSQSSNAAGSMVWREAMYIRRFGTAYPAPKPERDAFLKLPKTELGKLAIAALEEPLAASGIDPTRMRLGTFFTRTASNAIPAGGSFACPNELLRWLIKLEQGKLVDEWSSAEIKKLMYFVRGRYRYANSPALSNAAVFFKSGSFFECSPGARCGSYAGNKTNLMHSVAIVESGEKRYLIALMSNVLGVNSAAEHERVAGEIEKLVQSRPK